MIRFTNYVGNKRYLVPLLQAIVEGQKFDNYFEPFAGSFTVYLNVGDADAYYLGDTNEMLMEMFQQLALSGKAGAAAYAEGVKLIETLYGDIKEKEAYYAFRNAFNKENLADRATPTWRAVAHHALINSCINSFPRWSRNGFNQSCGRRWYKVDSEGWSAIQARVKSAPPVLHVGDYREMPWEHLTEDSITVLDPPYLTRPQVYSGDGVLKQESDLEEFLEWVNELPGTVLYTDVDSPAHREILAGFTPIRARKLRKTAPSGMAPVDVQYEYLYVRSPRELALPEPVDPAPKDVAAPQHFPVPPSVETSQVAVVYRLSEDTEFTYASIKDFAEDLDGIGRNLPVNGHQLVSVALTRLPLEAIEGLPLKEDS